MALPPSPMTPPPIGSAGPGGPRTGNPGMKADAMTKVREAVHLLEMSLPALDVGSEEHKTVLKMITDGSKVVPAGSEQPGVQNTTLAGLADRAKQMSMLTALQAGGQQGGGAGQQAPAAGQQPAPPM